MAKAAKKTRGTRSQNNASASQSNTQPSQFQFLPPQKALELSTKHLNVLSQSRQQAAQAYDDYVPIHQWNEQMCQAAEQITGTRGRGSNTSTSPTTRQKRQAAGRKGGQASGRTGVRARGQQQGQNIANQA